MTAAYILLAIAAGIALSVQIGVNNALRAGLGSPIIAAFLSFAVGTGALFCYALVTRAPWPPLSLMQKIPAWTWLGGLLGAFYVAGTIVSAPRLGAASLISILVTTQLITSLLLDHFGLVGFAQHSINIWRVLGAVLLIAGVLLIVRN